jgi:hypothetical protein
MVTDAVAVAATRTVTSGDGVGHGAREPTKPGVMAPVVASIVRPWWRRIPPLAPGPKLGTGLVVPLTQKVGVAP